MTGTVTAPPPAPKNPNVRRNDESQQQYRERLRSEQGASSGVTHMTSHRFVAQDKRDALKRRNRLRSKR